MFVWCLASTMTFLSLFTSGMIILWYHLCSLLVSKALRQILIFKLVLFKSTGRPVFTEVNRIQLCISFRTCLSTFPNRDILLKWGFMIYRKASERKNRFLRRVFPILLAKIRLDLLINSILDALELHKFHMLNTCFSTLQQNHVEMCNLW